MESDRQLYALDLAIQTHPDAAVNYLLRGEYWLVTGDLYQAQDDLLAAQELAEEALNTDDWGYIDQSYLDRADEMLAVVRQQMKLNGK